VKSVGRWILLLACGWFAAARPSAAQPEDLNVVRARQLFRHGVEAYDRGVYYDALQAFQDAYQLRPHPSVRVNIANCYEKLDRPAEAIQNFEQFLGSGAGTTKQQEEVLRALEQLRKRVGRLLLRVSPEGAKVVIDGGEPLRAPIAELVQLKVGRHQLTVSLDMHETAMRIIDIAAAGTTELTINLPRLDGTSPASVASAPPPSAASTVPQLTPPPAAALPPAFPIPAARSASEPAPDIAAGVWIAGGITFAAVLTSILTGQLALAADRDFNSDLAEVRNLSLSAEQRAAAWDDGISAADRAHAFAVTTDVLLSCAVVGAVLTTVIYLNDQPSANESTVRVAGSPLGFQARF
jgi:hypothetical protein